MRVRRFGPVTLGALLALGLTTTDGSFAERARWEFTGSCYCRSSGELRCESDQTERQCRQRCIEELCDDWFWVERRSCWNWGYGG